METQASSIAGTATGVRQPATVNDFLPGDPGSLAGRRYPEVQAPVEVSEIEAAPAEPYISLPESVVRKLVLASDVLCEHAKSIVGDTPAIVGLETRELLVGAGLIDEDTHEPTEAFEIALAIAGESVGIGTIDPFAADVARAESSFLADEDGPSPDPDWPDDPVPPAMDALPRAGSFAHD